MQNLTPEKRANKRYSMYRWSYKHKNGSTDGMLTRNQWEEYHAKHGRDDTGRVNDLRKGKKPNHYSKLRFQRGAQRLCMCRYRDIGPYAADNVYLATLAQNSSDVKRGESFKRGGRPKGSKNRTKNI